ncbi:DUF1501 domain-containing protein [Lentisphaera marina]|uniref:DUF1501 domain-containing protein n=1 Tax=Lentisphaera marina TaxID=1111041 RepID=UPI0023673EEE|nr:DUF1501 domain-containing protein [Lentisphaera marina]MDD7985212.1 DUF1501 domain-containing protein [Lentisphaera marina]
MMDRRQFLGGLSVLGGSLPFLHGNEQVINPQNARAKSVIYIWLGGGLSQYESFNVNFNKDVLGKSRPIKTNVDGIQISHYMPHMAKQMDKVQVLTTMKTNQGAHPAGVYKALTGYNPRSSITHPELGAWVSKLMTHKDDSLPNFVAINSRRGATSGFFPGMYAALPVLDPNKGILYSKIHEKVSSEDYSKRHKLLNALNSNFDQGYGTKDTRAYTDIYRNSLNFMNSKDISAFDLRKEDESIAKLYAKDNFSQGCLLAARLAEKGVRFSKVALNGWDYHKDLYKDLPPNINKLDLGLSALLQHLSLKGLLDTTLVVVATEFGRKPEVNVNVGRDHHPNGFTCLLAGAGVKSGEIYGKMSLDGKEPVENPMEIEDLNATIGWALGLDPSKKHISSTGRPFSFANKGKAQKQLFQGT